MRPLRHVPLLLFVALLMCGLGFAETDTSSQKPEEQTAGTPDGNSSEKSTPGGKPGVQGIPDGKSGQETDQRLAITREVMDEFARGELAAVRARFSADLKDAVSDADAHDAHDQLFEIAGAFQSQISQAMHLLPEGPVYIARSQCARYKVELRLTFDDANQITDFRIGPVSDLSSESMEAAAREIADLLHRGQFADVNAKFNARLKGEMPADRLAASWTHILTHLGAFKSIQSARKDPDLDRVDVRCAFENGPMIVRLAFDPAGKVSRLWMLPAETEKDSEI